MDQTRFRHPGSAPLRTATQRIAVLIALGFVTSLPAPSHAQRHGYSGEWRLESPTETRARRQRAVEHVTSQMNFLMRGPATGRLMDATEPASALSLSDEGEQVTLSARGRRVRLEVGGPAVRVEGESGEGTLAARREAGRLVTIARGERGTRTTRYSLSEDGRRLILDITMAGEALPQSLRYRVTYLRR